MPSAQQPMPGASRSTEERGETTGRVNEMPRLGKKSYPYTAAGKAAYRKDLAKNKNKKKKRVRRKMSY